LLVVTAGIAVHFLVILWGLSGPAEIPHGKWGTVNILAYLVWTALFYAGVGTWLAVKIGGPLNVDRLRFEADFRGSAWCASGKMRRVLLQYITRT
jgi:putative ATP-binding cassette transporter